MIFKIIKKNIFNCKCVVNLDFVIFWILNFLFIIEVYLYYMVSYFGIFFFRYIYDRIVLI